jgi:putative ABC transport system permease protein
MILLLRVLNGAISQAVGQLLANKLRTFLSLLGVSIGIFCIIGVKAAINSLEDNIKGSFKKLGTDVIYVNKMPWNEDPGQNFWKYQRRPHPSINDYEAIVKKVKTADLAAFQFSLGRKLSKFQNNSVNNIFLTAVTYDYAEMFKLQIEKGRYYSFSEYNYGTNVAIIGSKVAEELFGTIDPIDKVFTIGGRKMRVTGVIASKGRDMFSPNWDEAVIIPLTAARKFANIRPRKNSLWGTQLMVKAAEGVKLERLKDDVTGVLRATRHLKPKEKNDFAMNEMSILFAMLDNIFVVLNLAGLIIGGFALLVGMFSVANIMFVSVKERTNIIGIKKAIGAKKSVILLEFLIESVILCTLGGAAGLISIYGITWILTQFLPFDIYLSFSNALVGVFVSVSVGIIAGMIPALQAANMDPVEAMRK